MRRFLKNLLGFLVLLGLLVALAAYRNGFTLEQSLDLNHWKAFYSNPDQLGIKDLPEIPESPSEPSLTYDERMKKGDYYFQRGFLTFALHEYAKAAQQDPSSAQPHLKLLVTYFELGDYEKARRNAEAALRIDSSLIEAKRYLVSLYLKQGLYTEAENLLTELLVLAPDEPQLLYSRALTYVVSERFEEAKPFFEKIQTHPDFQERVKYFMTSYDEFKFAQSAQPLYLAELMARSLNQTKEYELSISLLKSILKQRADLRDSWIMLGFAYLNLNKYYFALTAFEKAYEIDSQWPATQYFLGLTHTELGNTKEAALFLEYADQNGFEPKALVKRKRADLYLEMQDYAAAVAAYEEILTLNSQDIGSFVRPVWIYLDFLNNPQRAYDLALKAQTLFPDQAMTFNLLGWSQTGLQKYSEAEVNLKRATEINPDFAAAFYNLGKLYMLMDQKSNALDAFKRAYELDQTGSIGTLAAQRYNELSQP